MAVDIQLNHAAGPAVTMATEDVTTTNASTLTAAVDLGTPGPIALGFEFKFSVLTSADDFVHLQCVWSNDGSDFGDLNNVDTIFSAKCSADSAVIVVGAFPVKARYIKFRYLNESGGTVDGDPTPPTLVLTDLTYDQA